MRATRQGQLRDHRPDRDDARSGFHAGAALLRIDPARDPKAASILSCIERQIGVLSGPRGACPRPFSGTERTELIRHSGTAVTCARLAHRPSVFCTWTNPGVSACFEPVDQQFPRYRQRGTPTRNANEERQCVRSLRRPQVEPRRQNDLHPGRWRSFCRHEVHGCASRQKSRRDMRRKTTGRPPVTPSPMTSGFSSGLGQLTSLAHGRKS